MLGECENPVAEDEAIINRERIMTDKLLTVQEAAERMGLHHQTLRKIIKTGRLKASRIGRVLRIRPEDVEAFIETSQIEQPLFGHPAREAAWDRFRELRERLSLAGDLTTRTGVEILSGMRR